MKQVREGWVVFSDEGFPLNRIPHKREDDAWGAMSMGRLVDGMKSIGYTCRRVRVTIEELDEKGES